MVGPGELEVQAGWVDGGRSVALVTVGSSSCPPDVTDVTRQADGSVGVTLTDPADRACTRDLAPRASLAWLPEGVDAGAPIDLVVTYGDKTGDVGLDAYAGPEVEPFTPSAGWVGDGRVAIVTFGSSTCVPAIESVTVDAPTEATVVFAALPDGAMCTADMRGRAQLALVDGLSRDGATVSLSGGDFPSPVTVPVVG